MHACDARVVAMLGHARDRVPARLAPLGTERRRRERRERQTRDRRCARQDLAPIVETRRRAHTVAASSVASSSAEYQFTCVPPRRRNGIFTTATAPCSIFFAS